MKGFFKKLGRKYTTAVLAALLVGLNKSLNLGLDETTVNQIVFILGCWILGESGIDAASAFGEKKAKKENGSES